MTQRMGENITREWDEETYSGEVWDALQLLKIDGSKGVAALSEIADKGSGLAMMYLGSLYLRGEHGIAIDNVLGDNWLNKSFHNGSIEGGYLLAFHLMNEKNIKLSIDIYEKLSQLNYCPAQFSLGYYYAVGEKIEKNIDKAIYFFRLASKNGHFPSRHWLYKLQMEQKDDIIAFTSGLVKKIFFTLPFIFLNSSYPNSDRLRT